MVDTVGSQVFIGRFFESRSDGVLLLDVDTHSDGADGRSKQQFIEAAAQYGQWKQLAQALVPHDEIRSIVRLVDVTSS